MSSQPIVPNPGIFQPLEGQAAPYKAQVLLDQARLVLSITAYNWLHPSAVGAALAPAEIARKLRAFQFSVRRIIALGSSPGPFSKPVRRLKRKAQVTRRALALRIGR